MNKYCSVVSFIVRCVLLSCTVIVATNSSATTPSAKEKKAEGYAVRRMPENSYSVSRMPDNTYRVTFKGLADSKNDQVYYYALLRCAETTRDAGFSYFIVLKQVLINQVTNKRRGATPDTYTQRPEILPSGNITTKTHTTPGMSGYMVEVKIPGYTLTIKTLQSAAENKDATKTAFDAAATIAEIKAKYNLK